MNTKLPTLVSRRSAWKYGDKTDAAAARRIRELLPEMWKARDIRKEHLSKILDALKSVKEAGYQTGEMTYSLCIGRCASVHSAAGLSAATKLFDDYCKSRIKPSEHILHPLLHAAVATGSLDKYIKTEFLVKSHLGHDGLPKTVAFWNLYFKLLGKRTDIDSSVFQQALYVYKRMTKTLHLVPSIITFNELLKLCSSSIDLDYVLSEMQAYNVEADMQFSSTLIKQYGRMRDFGSACRVFKSCLDDPHRQPTSMTWNCLLMAAYSCKEFRYFDRIIVEMIEKDPAELLNPRSTSIMVMHHSSATRISELLAEHKSAMDTSTKKTLQRRVNGWKPKQQRPPTHQATDSAREHTRKQPTSEQPIQQAASSSSVLSALLHH